MKKTTNNKLSKEQNRKVLKILDEMGKTLKSLGAELSKPKPVSKSKKPYNPYNVF